MFLLLLNAGMPFFLPLSLIYYIAARSMEKHQLKIDIGAVALVRGQPISMSFPRQLTVSVNSCWTIWPQSYAERWINANKAQPDRVNITIK